MMCIRFEDLINNRDVMLNAMVDEVEKTGYKIPTPREEAMKILVDAIQPKKNEPSVRGNGRLARTLHG